jgi:hypothetical protein
MVVSMLVMSSSITFKIKGLIKIRKLEERCVCQLIFQHGERILLCGAPEKGTPFFVSAFNGAAIVLKSFTKRR